MNIDQQKLYNILEDRISAREFELILGSTLSKALSNYALEFEPELDIDYSELLIKTLDQRIFENKKFIEFLIKRILNDSFIQSILKELKIHEPVSYKIKAEISKKPSKKLAQYIIRLLDLNLDYYVQKPISDKVKKENVEIISPNKEFYLSLHNYQKGVKIEMVNTLKKPRSKFLVHMPTGSGKTRTSIEAIVDFLRSFIGGEGLVIWFAHSKELCQQAYDSLKNIWFHRGDFDLPIYRIFGEHDIDERILDEKIAVLFVGFQKFHSILNSQKELTKKLKFHVAQNTKLAIVDEAHKTLAKTYKHAIDFVTQMPDCRLIGLTATPGRSNDVNDENNLVLANYFNNNIISIRDQSGKKLSNPLKYLQDEEVLATVEIIPIEIKITLELTSEEISQMIRKGEIGTKDINAIACSAYRNKVIVHEIEKALENPEKDLVLVFACNVEHCIILEKLLEKKGIESASILSSTPSEIRDNNIAKFKRGELKVLINFGVLTTGFDAPKLKTLIIARPTNSIILYSQMVGRALRGPKNGGNKRNYIIDLKDNILNLGAPDFMFTYWEEFWDKKIEFIN